MKRFLERLTAYFSIVLLFILSVSLLFGYAYMQMAMQEQPMILAENHWFVTVLLPLLVLLFVLLKVCLKSNIRAKHIVLVFSLCYLAFGIYMILHAPLGLRADVQSCLESAKSFRKSHPADVLEPGSYLFTYPHQLGLVSFFRILGPLANPKALFSLNLLAVLLVQVMQVRISAMLFQNDRITKITALLSYLFLPPLFFILFAYNTLYSLAFAMAGIYFLLRFEEKKQTLFLAASLLCLVLATLLRSNLVILLIAIAIMLLLRALYQKRWLYVAVALLPILCYMLASKGLISGYARWSNQDLPGLPQKAWISIGLNNGGNGVPGMFSSKYIQLFNEMDFDVEETETQLNAIIAERLEYLYANPAQAANFFWAKIQNTWTDPLFQSIWSGPLSKELSFQRIQPSLLYEIYDDSRLNKHIALTLRGLLLLIYAFAALGIHRLFKNKLLLNSLYIPLYFLGGFLFHLFWETKSQYVVSHVYMLIPLAACGLAQLRFLQGRETKETVAE